MNMSKSERNNNSNRNGNGNAKQARHDDDIVWSSRVPHVGSVRKQLQIETHKKYRYKNT